MLSSVPGLARPRPLQPGLRRRSLRIDRQSFDGIFAIEIAELAVFVENLAFVRTPRPAIPETNSIGIITLGLQARKTISHGILHRESQMVLPPDKTPSPASSILIQRDDSTGQKMAAPGWASTGAANV